MQVDTQDRFLQWNSWYVEENSSANNTLLSKEGIETLIGGIKLAKYATKPSGKENAKSQWVIWVWER